MEDKGVRLDCNYRIDLLVEDTLEGHGLLNPALHTHDPVSLVEEAVEEALYRVPVMTGDEDVVISQRRQEEGIE